MYKAVTRSIEVRVEPSYWAERSDPACSRYVWAYRIQVTNLGRETVQLRTRYWRITDALGHTEEVHGEGVVGETPVLEPGECFEYSSMAPLTTPSGFMVGSYGLVTEDGEAFDVAIPSFSLDCPELRRSIH